MKNTSLIIRENTSGVVDFAGIIISLRSAYSTGSVVVIGYPGLPNVERKMLTGDAVLFETPAHGTIEVRAVSMNLAQAEFLVSQVAPKIGLLAGVASDDPNNTPFSEAELKEVASSITALKARVREENYLAAEQFDLLSRKLDDVQLAASRLGRKDWINYVAGSLTTLFVTAAFAPDVTRKILVSANEAFSWLFTSGLLLLP